MHRIQIIRFFFIWNRCNRFVEDDAFDDWLGGKCPQHIDDEYNEAGRRVDKLEPGDEPQMDAEELFQDEGAESEEPGIHFVTCLPSLK